MHIFTHLSPEWAGKTGYGLEADGMVENDHNVGQLLKKLDDLGVADNTIVVYTSDNGAEMMSWPDGGSTPYRGEKAQNWEGAYRVPTLIRWPGVIKPGTVFNQFFAHEDFLPTFAAAAGNPNIVEQCLKSCTSEGKSFHVHLDGYNLMPVFSEPTTESPRKSFLYWSDDGDLFAVRVLDWKISFIESNVTGLPIWQEGFDRLRAPRIYNLRSDPFERGPESSWYADWMGHRAFLIVPAQAIVNQWLMTFKDYPPRQKPASFNLDEVMRKLTAPQQD
jgi:arylsulfatase